MGAHSSSLRRVSLKMLFLLPSSEKGFYDTLLRGRGESMALSFTLLATALVERIF